jgi:hypothetical protein
MPVSTKGVRVGSKPLKDVHRASTIVQLLSMQPVAWLVMAALEQLHCRSAGAHVELVIAVNRHVSCI